MIGQVIGNYKIEAKIGEGGMGAVYLGVDTMLDREVAVKALKPELASQDSIVERFRKEAVTLAKLNHPNIATLYSLFRHGDELYMVLEFVRGRTLDTIMNERGALPSEEAIPVFCQVLDGIDHAHELGVVHRDIKPANMMLTEKGTLKVLDFGIARLLGSTRMTRAGNIIGTLEYMAPEQVRGLETDGRSDIYALGMMLYEVLTGRLPFDFQNEFELMKAQTEQMPQPPRELNPAIPEAVEEAIMRAVRKDPDERFQTAGEFRDMLFEAGLGSEAVMHGATGSYRRASISKPPISRSDAVYLETDQPVIKGTRLAPAQQNELNSSPPVMAPTRIATLPQAPALENAVAPPPNAASFFNKLGIFHYVAAAAVVLILIVGVIAVPFIYFASTSPSANAVNADKKSEVKTTVEERPAVEPPRPALTEPTSTTEVIKDSMNSSSTGRGADKTKNERSVVNQRPAPAQKKTAPAPAGPKCDAKAIAQGRC